MSNKILVYIDSYKGQPHPSSWEALGAGKTLAAQLGGGVSVLAIGPASDKIAALAFEYGADQAFYADEASLADYRAEPYAAVLTQVARENSPEVVLLPTTSRGRELAAMSAIDLGSGVLADVTALAVQDGRVLATRPVYAGKLIAKVVCEANPQFITTRIRAFPPPEVDASRTG